jgi:hypothetical protein
MPLTGLRSACVGCRRSSAPVQLSHLREEAIIHVLDQPGHRVELPIVSCFVRSDLLSTSRSTCPPWPASAEQFVLLRADAWRLVKSDSLLLPLHALHRENRPASSVLWGKG